MRFVQRFFTALVAAGFLAVFVCGALTGCKPEQAIVSKIGLQYAVGNYLEKLSPEKRASEAREILDAVKIADEIVGRDSTTVDALRAYFAQRLADFPPSKRLALGNLIDVAASILKERVGDGVLKPSDALVVKDVLSWVGEAASAYLPPEPDA